MKGGFGKFLTFILGLVVGVLLVGGTIAGVVYYAVAAVSVNDVENYTKQEFTFIDKDAEIRNKSILDIYDMVKGGNIKETTVSDAKRIFGIDIIKILENSLEITVDDKSRETLGAMKVADVFKDNNLKVVLNCFTLGDVLKKADIDTTTGLASKPIVQEHISEPVIDGFNALLKSLEINEMTIAEMQYLLGVSFGAGGVLDTVANVKIGDLNSAINNIKFEDVLPDFDRDFYAEWNNTGAVLYKKESGGEIKLKQLIEDGADGPTSEFFKFVNTEAKDPAKTYYKLNREEGTIKVSDDGNWELKSEMDPFNPIWMMANSGARGNMGQIRQLAGMRGLVSDPSGRTIELPVKANYREGLSVLEYFISSHGGRKGLADTALKTADSGYLTRRLVDVSQDVIVNEDDCGDTKGVEVTAIYDGKNRLETLAERIDGRYTVKPVLHPVTGEVLVEADTMILPDKAQEIDKILTDEWIKNGSDLKKLPKVAIRSILSCKTRHGVCAKCYGKNMASGNPVKLGEAVGIIAAQSIGEPGTQLTMRTFHSGGVATSDDITQGLPRVEELFEARRPKGQAVIAENSGVVTRTNNDREIIVTSADGEIKSYAIPYGAKLKVDNGSKVEPGDPFTQGSINLQDMLRARGVKGVQDYVTKEVQSAYRNSGVDINDKHIEVIVRQMLRKVKIESQGSTDMLPGTLVDIFAYEDANQKTPLPITASARKQPHKEAQ